MIEYSWLLIGIALGAFFGRWSTVYLYDKYQIKEQVKNIKLSKKIVELKRAVAGIAPWLSASLDELSDSPDGKYEAACNEIFRLDDVGEDFNNPDVGEAL